MNQQRERCGCQIIGCLAKTGHLDHSKYECMRIKSIDWNSIDWVGHIACVIKWFFILSLTGFVVWVGFAVPDIGIGMLIMFGLFVVYFVIRWAFYRSSC